VLVAVTATFVFATNSDGVGVSIGGNVSGGGSGGVGGVGGGGVSRGRAGGCGIVC
jgi:hypothetical protein